MLMPADLDAIEAGLGDLPITSLQREMVALARMGIRVRDARAAIVAVATEVAFVVTEAGEHPLSGVGVRLSRENELAWVAFAAAVNGEAR